MTAKSGGVEITTVDPSSGRVEDPTNDRKPALPLAGSRPHILVLPELADSEIALFDIDASPTSSKRGEMGAAATRPIH